MEKLEQLTNLTNLTNAEGEVITLFNGKITLSQFLVIICGLLAVLIVIKVLKKTMRMIMIAIIAYFSFIYLGAASPTYLYSTAENIQKEGISSFAKIVESSDRLKIEDQSILVQVEEDIWLDVTEIDSMMNSKNGITIISNGESYVINDQTIINLLNELKEE